MRLYNVLCPFLHWFPSSRHAVMHALRDALWKTASFYLPIYLSPVREYRRRYLYLFSLSVVSCDTQCWLQMARFSRNGLISNGVLAITWASDIVDRILYRHDDKPRDRNKSGYISGRRGTAWIMSLSVDMRLDSMALNSKRPREYLLYIPLSRY